MMSNLFWLTDAQMARLRPFFPKSHGKPRVDDRRVLSGIIFINRNGLSWCDAPREYGPPKTLYNRWKRWGDMGVFARMMEGLASEAADRMPPHGFAAGPHRGRVAAARRPSFVITVAKPVITNARNIARSRDFRRMGVPSPPRSVFRDR
jgi:transposase